MKTLFYNTWLSWYEVKRDLPLGCTVLVDEGFLLPELEDLNTAFIVVDHDDVVGGMIGLALPEAPEVVLEYVWPGALTKVSV